MSSDKTRDSKGGVALSVDAGLRIDVSYVDLVLWKEIVNIRRQSHSFTVLLTWTAPKSFAAKTRLVQELIENVIFVKDQLHREGENKKNEKEEKNM